MDCSLPGSSVHGILQARILKWVTIPFSKGSSLLQGIFPTQGSNPGLPHCSQILHHLSHPGSMLFPLDSGKKYKTISNKLSKNTKITKLFRIQLLVIKFPKCLFLVTFILSNTINAQLNHTVIELNMALKLRVSAILVSYSVFLGLSHVHMPLNFCLTVSCQSVSY